MHKGIPVKNSPRESMKYEKCFGASQQVKSCTLKSEGISLDPVDQLMVL